MIAKLSGRIIYRGTGFIVLDCGDVGYKVTLPEEQARALPECATLYTHEAQREDGRELFGFPSFDALELFWRLISVSGVGPRGGQKIVFSAPVAQVREHVMRGNVAFLKSVPGIGTKTAQKIIIELKGALAESEEGSSVDAEAAGALEALGYSRRQAEDVLALIDADTTEERVGKALRLIGKTKR